MDEDKVSFGFEDVSRDEKSRRVKGVFASVAGRYDLMNDLMSAGVHRIWKANMIAWLNPQPGETLIDVAGGTGDVARAFQKRAGDVGRRRNVTAETMTFVSDINEAMLREGRDRLVDQGLALPSTVCDAEHLPFRDQTFDLVSVSFGLRNMTHKEAALKEMCRVLRPGGRLLVLEFSKVAPALQGAYDWYSFKVLPRIGQWVAGDAESYRYLAESIRMHPDQATLKAMMKDAGFGHVDVHNLTGGLVALHVGIRC